MSTTEAENKELVRQRVTEALAEGHLDRLDEYLTDNYVEHTTAAPEDLEGLEAVEKHYARMREAIAGL
ncbi:MAG: nuclear transport factor 2 family protein [Halovenus sp.]